MVLPLIPAALWGFGLVTGASGSALAAQGVRDMRDAARRGNDVADRVQRRWEQSEARAEQTNARLQALGQLQEECLQGIVTRMVALLRRHGRRASQSDSLLADGLDTLQREVDDPSRPIFDRSGWVAGAVTSLAVGSGVRAGAIAAATTWGTASTGAALSGLSGAAAESAVTAFFGGGAIAAGGAGAAVGATALTAGATGPAVLVAGITAKTRGTRAQTVAREREVQGDVVCASFDERDGVLCAIDQRTDELRAVLAGLRERAASSLDELESLVDLDLASPAHAEAFQRAYLLVKAVKDVCLVPILTPEGEFDPESRAVTVRYRSLSKGE